PEILTIGFARRFATYKRPNLLWYNKERLMTIFKNAEWPVQLVIAGKAHPADHQGQAMIREWVEFSRRKEVRDHIVFLSDYDMNLARRMVQGVDVWLNNPRRPWEASGTSGMKVLVNGGLNLSELDGWWAEAYEPTVGWAIGDGKEHVDEAALDNMEAEQLYQILEQEVIPTFYHRDEQGIPQKWIQMIKQSMARLTPRFSASRTVIEYTEKYYLPAALGLHRRLSEVTENGLAQWQNHIRVGWAHVSVGEVHVKEKDGRRHVTTPVHLSTLHPQQVQVELFAEGINSPLPTRILMEPQSSEPDDKGIFLYQAEVDGSRS